MQKREAIFGLNTIKVFDILFIKISFRHISKRDTKSTLGINHCHVQIQVPVNNRCVRETTFLKKSRDGHTLNFYEIVTCLVLIELGVMLGCLGFCWGRGGVFSTEKTEENIQLK